MWCTLLRDIIDPIYLDRQSDKCIAHWITSCKLGVVVEGGRVRMVIMSLAACYRKSSSFISGNNTVVGKKVAVSQSLIFLVLDK